MTKNSQTSKSTFMKVLFQLCLACVSFGCLGQNEYYPEPPKRFTVFVGATRNVAIESSKINPVVSLAYHFKSFEPEISIRKEYVEQKSDYNMSPMVRGEDYYYLICKGYSLQMSFPIAVTRKNFGVQIGPAVQIPFMRVFWKEHSRSLTWPAFSDKDVMSWSAPRKPILCLMIALRYDSKKYSFKTSAFKMLKQGYLNADAFGYGIPSPINLSASLGYRF